MKAVVKYTVFEKPQLIRAIKRLERDILRMGALVEQSFRLSHQALFNRDLTAAEQIRRLDKKIDRFYRQIEVDCVSIMSSQAPTEQESRCLSSFMQLVRDLERIGDYAKDLAEIAMKIFPYPPHPTLGEVAIMSDHAQSMLATSLVALADLDEISGRRIKLLDDTVDDAYKKQFNV
jgi:phosphate transport system protein